MPPRELSWQTLKQIVDQAATLPPAERTSYLDATCLELPAARPWAESLLELDGTAASGSTPPPNELSARPLEGSRLGPYRVLEEIDRGGMGAVYLAERVDGEYQQQVAIKVVNRGPLTAELRQRFLVERQVLARLTHPNIARLLDGGTTDDGIPYLVMERIDGLRITEYCQHRKPTLEDRLRLMIEVCRAVESAHRSLVVHRDLKPGNILVTVGGRVKLLDFGIAKLLGDQSPGEALTRVNQMPGTLGYASPEQLMGEPVTTASDVYSLGIVLFELLTGRLPFGEDTDSFKAVARILRADQPMTPSKAVQEASLKGSGSSGWRALVARFRAADSQNARLLRGDLDRIVLKAIAHNAGERYGNAAELANDLGRYLRREPVTATPPSLPYLVGRFVRRRRGTVLAASLVLLSLVGGLVARSLEARRANLARATAEAERIRAEQLATFMLTDLWRRLDTIDRVDMLLPVAEEIEKYFRRRAHDDPSPSSLGGQADALQAISDIKTDAGEPAAAVVAQLERLEIVRRLAPSQPPRQAILAELDVLADLALALHEDLRFEAAAEQLKSSLDLAEKWLLTHPDDVEVARARVSAQDEAGIILYDQGELESAREVFEKAARWLDQPPLLGGETWEDLLLRQMVLMHIGVVLTDLGQPREALGPLEGAVEVASEQRRRQPEGMASLITVSLTRVTLAACLRQLGEIEKARSLVESAAPELRQAVARDPLNAELRYQLTQVLFEIERGSRAAGDTDAATRALRETVDIASAMSATDHAYLRDAYVRALIALGRADEAADIARRLLAEGWDHQGFRRLCAEHGLATLELSPAAAD